MVDLSSDLCRRRRCAGRRGGSWRQGLEPDAPRAGGPARAARFRAADGLAPARGAADREAALRQALTTESPGSKSRPASNSAASRRPLLVSVRSGAAVSMPGMMETVLDVGLNAETVEALIRLTGNPRLAWDSYRRLVQGYAEVVAESADGALRCAGRGGAGAATRLSSERELDHRSLRALTLAMLDCYRALTGKPIFPPIRANSCWRRRRRCSAPGTRRRRVSYRRLNGIGEEGGTAVTVQSMVFGNAGGASGSGVGFTRNPATGARGVLLRLSVQRAGRGCRRRTPAPGRPRQAPRGAARPSSRGWPRFAANLKRCFTTRRISSSPFNPGRCSCCRRGGAKRTDWAALTIAADMVAEGLLTPAEALERLDGVDLEAVVRTSFAEPLPPPLGRRRWRRASASRAAPSRSTSDAVKRLAAGGRTGDPRAARHGDDGYRGHGAGRRHPHRLGRAHVPRGGGGAPARQGVPRRLRGA